MNMARVVIIMYMGTVKYVHSRVDTIIYGHKRVWAQSSLTSNVPGYKCVWAQTCLGTGVLVQPCMGTVVWSPDGYIIKKLTLYDRCCDRLFQAFEKPNRAYTGTLSTAGLKNRSIRSTGTIAKALVLLMLPAMLSGVQHWTKKVPEF